MQENLTTSYTGEKSALVESSSSSKIQQTELQKNLSDLEKEIENIFDKFKKLENKLQMVLRPQNPTKGVTEDRIKKNSVLSENLQQRIDELEKINNMLMDLIERLVD